MKSDTIEDIIEVTNRDGGEGARDATGCKKESVFELKK